MIERELITSILGILVAVIIVGICATVIIMDIKVAKAMKVYEARMKQQRRWKNE